MFSSVSHLSVNSQAPDKPGKKSQLKADFKELKQLVGEIRPDDGVDPREEFKRRRKAMGMVRPGFSHGVHKEEQLLTQVQSAIESALQCAREPLLNQLEVREVVKQGGALAVVVTPQAPLAAADLRAVNAAIARASSMIAREVAATITRKDAPKLHFVVLPADAKKIDE